MIDTHVHVSSSDTVRFPTVSVPEGARPWWLDPNPLDRMLDSMDRCRVDRVMLVHAFGAYGPDNSYVLSVGATDPRARAVLGLDLSTPHALVDLETLAAAPGVRSVRVLALNAANDGWLEDDRGTTLFKSLSTLGLPLIVCAFGPQLSRLRPLVVAHPDVPVVIDDCGVASLEGALVPAAHPLHSFAELEHVRVKIFSPMLLAAAQQGSACSLVEQVVGQFGAERVAWGSNYPQSGLSYAALVAAARDATSSLSSSDREAVLEGTAAGLWFD